MNDYYTYVYLNPLKPGNFVYGDLKFDFEPFYIGKGRLNRHKIHLTDAKHKKWHMHNTIRNIWANNSAPIIIKLLENSSEQESWNYEKKLISDIGRYDLNKGPLSNMTDGGDGPGNRIPWNKGLTALTNEKVRQYGINGAKSRMENPVPSKLRGIPLSEETKEKIRITCRIKGLANPPFKGKNHTDKTREKMKLKWIDRKKLGLKKYRLLKDGNLFEIEGMYNFKDYCEKNKLYFQWMVEVSIGKRQEYKGYTKFID